MNIFFIASKILHFLLEPLTWVFVFLLFSLWLKDQTKKRRFLKTALILFWIATNSFLSNEMARIWEFKPRDLDSASVYKAGIVLGGTSFYDKEFNRIVFRGCPDRILQALSLYKTGKIDKIIFTGGSGYLSDPTQTEGKYVYQYLRSLDIPEEDLIFENNSRNTRENALFTKELIDSLAWSDDKFLLITSSNHMLRARGCFNRVKIQSDLYPVDRIAFERKYSIESMLFPNIEALVVWRQVLHEFFGYTTYKIAGYI